MRHLRQLPLGGHGTTFGYDPAGRLVERGTGGEAQRYSYLNTALVDRVEGGSYAGGGFAVTGTTSYGYDALGRKVSERAVTGGVMRQDATAPGGGGGNPGGVGNPQRAAGTGDPAGFPFPPPMNSDHQRCSCIAGAP